MTRLSGLFRDSFQASSGLDWKTVSTNTTAVSGSGYILMASSDITLTLPSDPADGDVVGVVDGAAQASALTIKIARNGKLIHGAENDFELTTNRSSVIMTYSGDEEGWVVTSDSAGSNSYQPKNLSIPDSCMFDSGNSDYMSRTPSSAGNRKTWTFSTWVKRGKLALSRFLLMAESDPNNCCEFLFNSTTNLYIGNFTGGSADWSLTTNMLFRDTSAWYHIIVSIDTTQPTSSNRVKLYVNGTQITSFSSASYPSQNSDTYTNGVYSHQIGRYSDGSYFDGYLAETILVDGQALTPSSFGQFDDNGIWSPKGYTGSFGTNGFRLNYADSSNLGKDVSGNSNNFTTSGLTTSSQYDDTPTNNYCVLNGVNNLNGAVISKGNLYVSTATGFDLLKSTFFLSSGKWYWEVTANNLGSGYVGISDEVATDRANNSNSVSIRSTNGDKRIDSVDSTYGASISDGSIIMFALDMDSEEFYVGVNGNWASGSGAWNQTFSNAASALSSITNPVSPSTDLYDSESATFNFGQRPFTYTPPTGFKALCTANLATPAIVKPDDYFDIDLYTGTNATQSRSALDFQPDLIWFKNRTGTNSHALVDSVRGRAKTIYSNTTAVEASSSASNDLVSFDTNGFTIGPNEHAGSINISGGSIVAWCWKKGVAPGFDIVSYTGTGVNRTIAHSLGDVPDMMIVKNRSTSGRSWRVYHRYSNAAPQNYVLYLDASDAATAEANTWNNTAPTSSVFTVGTEVSVNASGDNFVAYLFSGVEGFSRFGKYTGNGNADGPFVWCGFRPAYVLIKRIDAANNWAIQDIKRLGYNVDNIVLYADVSNAEGTTKAIDILSNGFKLRDSGDYVNASSGSYIFAAFAETPFKYARAR